MLVLLDSNLFFSALISPHGPPAAIYKAWLDGRFQLLTCPHQLEEIRRASRYPKFREILQPHRVGTMLNRLHNAQLWKKKIPGLHESADPGDTFLLNLIAAAQPDYAVTGDKKAGILKLKKLGKTRILNATDFLKSLK